MITLVLARAKNNVIGRGGGLPWRIPSDLKTFRAATMGKPILMGRKTWESLPKKPLDGRPNLIVTHDAAFAASGAFVYADLSLALAAGQAMAAEKGGEVCVIGGAALFAETLPRAERLILTEIDLEPEGDVFFPSFDERAWREISRVPHERGPKDDAAFVVRTLERIR
ncbi:MAG: dihydrofolate reductase [Hyphomonadaceae bacterium]